LHITPLELAGPCALPLFLFFDEITRPCFAGYGSGRSTERTFASRLRARRAHPLFDRLMAGGAQPAPGWVSMLLLAEGLPVLVGPLARRSTLFVGHHLVEDLARLHRLFVSLGSRYVEVGVGRNKIL